MTDDDDNPLLKPVTNSEIQRIVGEDSASGRITQPAIPGDVSSAPPSARMGKFVRVSKLGAGGMGEVWKAWDSDLGRWVALKILKSTDEEEVVRFAREAQIAGKLSHPYIASIYEVGEDQGRRFIAMQYIDGLTLRAVPRGDGVRFVRLIHDAARAVAYAHSQGIIHRDLKPENLMVRQHAKDLHVYVMDFGLARAIDARTSLSGSIVGTPAYMPPEQARGQRVDARADVYSLGATLYELLAGRPPFSGTDLFNILTKVQNEDPPPLTRVDPDLALVIFKSLEKEPDRRYPTATAFADDLFSWMRGEPVTARRPSMAYRTRKWIGRYKRVLIPTLIALIAGAVTGAILFKRPAPEAVKPPLTLQAREQALKDLESARAVLDQAMAVVYSRDARLEELQGLCDQALERIRAALIQAPELALGHHLLGLVHELRNDDVEAEAAWRRAIELDPTFAAARVRLGRLLLGRVWLARSHDSAEGIERARSGSEKIAREANALLRAAKSDDPMQADLAAALLAFSLDDTAEAARIATAAATRAGDRRGAEDLFWLAAVVSTSRTESLRLADHAIAIRPKFPFGLYIRAWLFRANDQPREALADLNDALRQHPLFFNARMNRGYILSFQGDFDASLEDYLEAARIQQGSGLAWLNVGLLRLRKRDLPGAREALREAVRVQPDFAPAHFQLGNVLKLLGDPEAGLQEWSEAIRLKPDFADARVNRGNARMRAGDFAGAEADYDTAVRADPGNPENWLHRGHARYELGDRKAAIADLEECLRIAPERWPLHQSVVKMLEQFKQ